MSADAIPDDEDEAFQLPMLGLYADLEIGCGSVLLPDEFHHAPPAVQRRLLADWQRGLAAVEQGLLARGALAAPPDAGAATLAAVPAADSRAEPEAF